MMPFTRTLRSAVLNHHYYIPPTVAALHLEMPMSLARTVLRAGGGRHIVRVRNALVPERKEAMSVRDEMKSLTWYACGPTVYDDAHLGHARTYIAFDVARRILHSLARIRVDFCMGITDIDDKIIARAGERHVSPRKLARDYESRFFADMHALNVQSPTRIVRVTEHIPDIVRVIAELVESNAAYPTADGSVYFNVSNAPKYGVLHQSATKHDSTTPREPSLQHDENGITTLKKDRRDFALWKSGEGKVNPKFARWDSPWGVGRPGWHVECTAMIRASLGHRIDVHSGGIDLKFPHHENELVIANELRNCACVCGGGGDDDEQNERWVQSWLHTGQLEISGDKMSKSKKNFITIRDYFDNGGNSDVFRMFCLNHRYNTNVEYSEDRIRDAENFLQRCKRFVINTKKDGLDALGVHGNNDNGVEFDFSSKSTSAEKLSVAVERCREAVEEALVDDFDTPRALMEISQIMTKTNIEMRNCDGATAIICMEAGRFVATIFNMLGITGFVGDDVSENNGVKNVEDARVLDELVVFRNMVRSAAKGRDWGRVFSACDEVRAVLRDRFGVEVRDGVERFKWDQTGPGSKSPFTGRKRPVTTEENSDSDN